MQRTGSERGRERERRELPFSVLCPCHGMPGTSEGVRHEVRRRWRRKVRRELEWRRRDGSFLAMSGEARGRGEGARGGRRGTRAQRSAAQRRGVRSRGVEVRWAVFGDGKKQSDARETGPGAGHWGVHGSRRRWPKLSVEGVASERVE